MLFTQACDLNAEHLTIFGNRASCDWIAVFTHLLHQLFVSQRGTFILRIDEFLENLLDLTRGDLVTFCIKH